MLQSISPLLSILATPARRIGEQAAVACFQNARPLELRSANSQMTFFPRPEILRKLPRQGLAPIHTDWHETTQIRGRTYIRTPSMHTSRLLHESVRIGDLCAALGLGPPEPSSKHGGRHHHGRKRRACSRWPTRLSERYDHRTLVVGFTSITVRSGVEDRGVMHPASPDCLSG